MTKKAFTGHLLPPLSYQQYVSASSHCLIFCAHCLLFFLFGSATIFCLCLAIASQGFLERTLRVGKVIGWAPQVALLAHRAIGGFVSHYGWNSVLESFWFGVPLATWPMYAEQQLNAFELVVELGLAVEIKLDYKKDVFDPHIVSDMVIAEEIERGIRQLMDNIEVRGKVKEMRRKSREVVAKDGSSFTSIGHLIHEFLSNIS